MCYFNPSQGGRSQNVYKRPFITRSEVVDVVVDREPMEPTEEELAYELQQLPFRLRMDEQRVIGAEEAQRILNPTV